MLDPVVTLLTTALIGTALAAATLEEVTRRRAGGVALVRQLRREARAEPSWRAPQPSGRRWVVAEVDEVADTVERRAA